MAVNEDSSAQKKSRDEFDEMLTFNAENMQSNARIIYYCRTFMSIVGGIITGILGYTSLMGFVFYFLVMAITTVGLAAKAKFSVHSYFDSWNRIILDGILGGLMSFVLFWTFMMPVLQNDTIKQLEKFPAHLPSKPLCPKNLKNYFHMTLCTSSEESRLKGVR